MLGAIAGDIIGSVYEWHNIKTTEFPLFSGNSRFTDDTVLTVALADAVLTGAPYAEKLKEYYRLYPRAGYGGRFSRWASSGESAPCNSYGNGSAMRTSPAGWACDTLDETLSAAERFAAVTHNHPEGIKGAQSVSAAIYLARTGSSKKEIKDYIGRMFSYDLSRTLEAIRPGYRFDVSCQGSVPEAVIAFLESTGYEDAVRKAVSLGGDSDTIACITGGIAEAFYGPVPDDIARKALALLDTRLRDVVTRFTEQYITTRRR
ncbi:MAG TPA: ADP-ribosylglycohydrolase family protein [Spirochaetota bacterium]|nr:ADP-ribosylglycohydrolase family protein [Spirochaetota bacterium]HPI88457.1 ADP-ribosylglycohydrolase family protein [Spirochaetota bacterium]HPR48820.1 ADP-ribosylglycohydrolase family protein [Spirochaetota bacterium]